MYTNTYLPGSQDLMEYSLKMKKGTKSAEYEKFLKTLFAKMYVALRNLKSKGYIYTDLKPANILLDGKLNPYLIDLESVIQTDSKQICIYTEGYYPVELKGIKRNLVAQDMERILSWTFCYTAYQAACTNKRVTTKSISTFQQSKSSASKNFLNTFQCDKKISPQFKEFLNNCLTKKAENNSFTKLIKSKWLNMRAQNLKL